MTTLVTKPTPHTIGLFYVDAEWNIRAENMELVGSVDPFNEKREGNRRLLAAAPLLRVALANLVSCPDYRGIETHEMRQARSILATLSL